MATVEIDTERGHDDVEQQVREMETRQLLAIYDMFVSHPTVFQMVSDEMLWRGRHERKIDYVGQEEEIRRRF